MSIVLYLLELTGMNKLRNSFFKTKRKQEAAVENVLNVFNDWKLIKTSIKMILTKVENMVHHITMQNGDWMTQLLLHRLLTVVNKS